MVDVALSEPPPRILEAARRLLTLALGRGPIAIACDNDVDGLAAAALTFRAIERRGGVARLVPAGRGEHVHQDRMRARIRATGAAALVVLDMGSRAGAILPGLPTIVVDHHRPAGTPEGALLVSSAGADRVAPTGLLAAILLGPWAPLDDLDWLPLLATVADLGVDHPFDELRPALTRYRRKHVTDAVALLNAARRAGAFRAAVALDVLLAASSPADIATGAVAGVDDLRAARAEVVAELARCGRIAPRVGPRAALIRFSSPAQVHPLVAVRWTRRLAGKIVIAANDDFLPGRVKFAVRCSDPDVDLLALLRGLPVGAIRGEYGHGHPRATGGSVPPEDFARILAALELPGPEPLTRCAPDPGDPAASSSAAGPASRSDPSW